MYVCPTKINLNQSRHSALTTFVCCTQHDWIWPCYMIFIWYTSLVEWSPIHEICWVANLFWSLVVVNAVRCSECFWVNLPKKKQLISTLKTGTFCLVDFSPLYDSAYILYITYNNVVWWLLWSSMLQNLPLSIWYMIYLWWYTEHSFYLSYTYDLFLYLFYFYKRPYILVNLSRYMIYENCAILRTCEDGGPLQRTPDSAPARTYGRWAPKCSVSRG